MTATFFDMDDLSDLYGDWCDKQNLHPIDAETLLLQPDLTDYQRRWLTQFVTAWKAVEVLNGISDAEGRKDEA